MQNKYITNYKISQAKYEQIADATESNLLKRVTIHKSLNAPIVRNLAYLDYTTKARNIDECGTFLEIYKDSLGIERISRANFCRERMCSVCAWRRQSRFLATTEPALRKIDIETDGKAKYIFITLTVKNCSAENLSSQITSLLRAWDRLYKRNPFAKYCAGAIRNLEVTYSKSSRTYHPHLHILALMKNEYFKKGNYIETAELSFMWKHALNVDYEPIVHLESIKSKHACETPLLSASLEVMKYSLKTTDYAISPKVTETLMLALKGRRLISFSGIIAQARKELKFAELDEDNLTDDITEEDINARKVLYLFTPTGWKISE